MRLIASDATGERGIVAALVGATIPRSFDVSNAPGSGVFARVPGRANERFAEVQDPVRLLRIIRALVRQRFGAATLTRPNMKTDPARDLSEASFRTLHRQLGAGYFYLEDPTQTFKRRLKGAALMTSKLLPPVERLLVARERQRAATLLRELGMGAPAGPRRLVSKALPVIVGLLVADVILLRLRLARSPREAFRLPRDFAVPADFGEAVVALERLTGASSWPLVGVDGFGGRAETGGFAVRVPAARASSLLDAAPDRFLERGSSSSGSTGPSAAIRFCSGSGCCRHAVRTKSCCGSARAVATTFARPTT